LVWLGNKKGHRQAASNDVLEVCGKGGCLAHSRPHGWWDHFFQQYQP
jgi:hypothetical protein